MRKVVVLFAFVVAVLLLPGVRDVSAQSITVAKVPFSFVVQGTVMPAGEYRLAMRRGDPSIMQIESTAGDAAVFVFVSSTGPAAEGAAPTLVFRRIAGGYFLSQINVPGDHAREISVPSGASAVRLAMRATGKPAIQG